MRLPISTPALIALAAALCSTAALIALERFYPVAGLMALLILVGSLGTVHGALDVLLMARHFQRASTRWAFAAFYLAATLITAGALWHQAALTLLLLLALSVWHFGEAFHTGPAATALLRVLERCVRGGAPVLIPALLAAPALKALVLAAVSNDPAASEWVWAVWHGAALLWLCGVCGWLMACALAQALRLHILIELAALCVLYAVATPLMAFALFFGLYHATGHIQRVLALVPAAQRASLRRDLRVLAALALSVILGLWLVQTMPRFFAAGVSLPDAALRTLILALTAVSVPHVLLVSWAAPILSTSAWSRSSS
jgi:beta-carotene 15,15'-dioxygenase